MTATTEWVRDNLHIDTATMTDRELIDRLRQDLWALRGSPATEEIWHQIRDLVLPAIAVAAELSRREESPR